MPGLSGSIVTSKPGLGVAHTTLVPDGAKDMAVEPPMRLKVLVTVDEEVPVVEDWVAVVPPPLVEVVAVVAVVDVEAVVGEVEALVVVLVVPVVLVDVDRVELPAPVVVDDDRSVESSSPAESSSSESWMVRVERSERTTLLSAESPPAPAVSEASLLESVATTAGAGSTRSSSSTPTPVQATAMAVALATAQVRTALVVFMNLMVDDDTLSTGQSNLKGALNAA